ncbi:MAG: hypothetical protein OER95_19825, partial [Acidimicrobiia bacterium]|nr:hypothetical protein [Acidimicrobiia bacterium]
GIRLQSENVGGRNVRMAVELTDSGERGVIGLHNRTLHFANGAAASAGAADCTLRCPKGTLVDLASTALSLSEALESGEVSVDDPQAAHAIFDNLDTHYTGFNIVTP